MKIVFLMVLLWTSLAAADPAPPVAPDFVQIRKDLLQKADFDPMAMEDAERSAIDASQKDWKEGRPDKTLDDLRALQHKYPASIPCIRNLAEASEAWADRAKDPEHKDLFAETAKRLREIQADLIHSITDQSDGKTEKTAWLVLDEAEEYEVVRYLRLKPQSQYLVNDAASGKAFDVFGVLDETGAKSKIYFDITRFWQAENHLFSTPTEKDESSNNPKADSGRK